MTNLVYQFIPIPNYCSYYFPERAICMSQNKEANVARFLLKIRCIKFKLCGNFL